MALLTMEHEAFPSVTLRQRRAAKVIAMAMTGVSQSAAAPVRVSFLAGAEGEWRVQSVRAIVGEPLPLAAALRRVEGPGFLEPAAGHAPAWLLRGVRSNERYIERTEKIQLGAVQEGLGRPASRFGALIPLRKTAAWWDLPQDERRAIFEAKSRHIAIGSRFLPAIARRLYHGRDLGEPFDFLTWFEFSQTDAGAFDELLGRLRETEEWRYVDHEVEVRLEAAGA
jgi:hypothetical protein